MKFHWNLALVAGLFLVGIAQAQEPVVAAKDPEALFRSSDPKLNANKQVIYHVVKDLLEGARYEVADQYMTERYIQHNPNIPSGRDGMKKMMAQFRNAPQGMASMKYKIVSVVAEGDMVVVAVLMELPDPKNPGKTYTTTSFDMWRIKDGKADEHWDAARLGPPQIPAGAPPAAPLPQ